MDGAALRTHPSSPRCASDLLPGVIGMLGLCLTSGRGLSSALGDCGTETELRGGLDLPALATEGALESSWVDSVTSSDHGFGKSADTKIESKALAATRRTDEAGE